MKKSRKPTTRALRNEVLFRPAVFRYFPVESSAWYESPEAIAQGLTRGKEKDRLLRWVRRRMESDLTERERACVEIYYFQGLPFRQAGKQLGLHASSVCRITRRAVEKLRILAQQEGIGWRRG